MTYGSVDILKIFLTIVDMDPKRIRDQLDLVIQQLQTLRALVVPLEPDANVAQLMEEERNGICHYCKKPTAGQKTTRGAHARCYQELKRSIQAGETTEELVMARGWLGSKKASGRKKAMTPLRALQLATATAMADVLKNDAKAKKQQVAKAKQQQVAENKDDFQIK